MIGPRLGSWSVGIERLNAQYRHTAVGTLAVVQRSCWLKLSRAKNESRSTFKDVIQSLTHQAVAVCKCGRLRMS